MIPAYSFGREIEARLKGRQRALAAALAKSRGWEEEGGEEIRMMRPGGPSSAGLSAAAADAPPLTIALALLFAQPHSAAIRQFAASHTYLDLASGADWDLFFPGYYEASEERTLGDIDVPTQKSDWWFSPQAFRIVCQRLNKFSKGAWRYSGGAELLVVATTVSATVPPKIDWETLGVAKIGERENQYDLGEAVAKIIGEIESGTGVTFPGASNDDEGRLGHVAREMIADVISRVLIGLIKPAGS